jgi:hypothetical protein
VTDEAATGVAAAEVALPGVGQGATTFCRWCGAAAGGCDGVVCRRELDPPHFCPACGRRLRVQVTPTGHRASCRQHGLI